jgi:excisionase family DNA binding protein
MSIQATGKDSKAIVVKPARACEMLSCGRTHLYGLIAAKELDSFLDGGARKITVASIHAYIERQLSVEALAP